MGRGEPGMAPSRTTQRLYFRQENGIRQPDVASSRVRTIEVSHALFGAAVTVPAIFPITSNRFPTATYGTSYNWVILSTLVVVGAVFAKFTCKA